MKRWVAGARFALPFTFLLASSASAAPIAGRNELDLQLSVVDHWGVTLTPEQSVDFGVPNPKLEVSNTSFGLVPSLGLGFGRAFGEHLLLHLRVGLGVLKQSSKASGGEEVSSRSVQFELTPSLRYVAPGQNARFFVGGAVGIGTWRSIDDDVGLDTESRQRIITVGPMLGFHGFLTDHVSLDPALELKMVSLSQGIEGSDERWSGVGVRVGVTLSLTGWLGTAKSKVPASETEGQWAASPAYTPRAAPPPVAATVHFDGFGISLRGMPETRGDALAVEVRRLTPVAEWEACPLVLTAEDGTQIAVQVTHHIAYAGKGRKEEQLVGWVSYSELAHWAEHTPGFSLCGRPHGLGPQDVMNVGLTLRQFKGRAVRAGTFKESVPAVTTPPPEAPPVGPEPSTPAPAAPNSAPATAPVDANPNPAAPPAP